MKSNDLQGHLECYIYWVNWYHTAPQAYFSLPLLPQVYKAIALLFDQLVKNVMFGLLLVDIVWRREDLMWEDLNREDINLKRLNWEDLK